MNSTDPRTQRLEHNGAIVRGLMYTFLGSALAYPNQEHQAVLREHIAPIIAQLDLAEGTAPLREALRGVDTPLEERRAAHTALFTLTVSADCPDYETAYDPRDIFQQAQAMADVAGFYRAYGLQVGGLEHQRPDHISTELEFMSVLAFKEAYALENLGQPEAEATREAQSLFLRDHLGCWGPAFGRRVRARADGANSFYAAVGALLTDWLIDECDRLDVIPARSMEEPRLDWLEPDDGACGVQGDCPLIGIDEIPVAN